MTKILLVEDDSNLREIYGARLEAEGYEIFSARDGEEALAIAVRERPELIISDIMMPKISGFDMLDILRSTPETKDVKVIVMTALSQEEDRKRGEQLGADRYLVKSQVTLDDVVSITKELLTSAPVASDSSSQPTDNTSTRQNTNVALNDTTVSNTQSNTATAQDTTTESTPESNAAQGGDISPADEASLDQEVQQFVENSPLMNGTAPQPQPQSNSLEDQTVQSESVPVAQEDTQDQSNETSEDVTPQQQPPAVPTQ